jgi:hypothetical protein
LKLTTKEEHEDKMLTPWEKELEILEDWLNHPKPVYDYHENIVMQMLAEKNSKEFLRNFSEGAEQMITAVLRHAVEDEAKFQSGEQLDEAGAEPTEEMAEDNLSEKVTEHHISQENKTAELNFAAGWQVEATKEKDGMGDLVDLPIFCRSSWMR